MPWGLEIYQRVYVFTFKFKIQFFLSLFLISLSFLSFKKYNIYNKYVTNSKIFISSYIIGGANSNVKKGSIVHVLTRGDFGSCMIDETMRWVARQQIRNARHYSAWFAFRFLLATHHPANRFFPSVASLLFNLLSIGYAHRI